MMIRISPNGRIRFPYELIFPDNLYVVGIDVLYSQSTEELAFEITRLKLNNHAERAVKIKELETTLKVKHDCSINISAYFGTINYFKIPCHEQILDFDAKVEGRYIVIKLNTANKRNASLSEFKKIELERIRHESEISISTTGLLSLPKSQLTEIFKKPLDQAKPRTSINFDPETKTFTLTLGSYGDKAIKKDGTLCLKTILKKHQIQINKRLFLPYNLDTDRITFCLTDEDPIEGRQSLKEVRKILGIFG